MVVQVDMSWELRGHSCMGVWLPMQAPHHADALIVLPRSATLLGYVQCHTPGVCAVPHSWGMCTHPSLLGYVHSPFTPGVCAVTLLGSLHPVTRIMVCSGGSSPSCGLARSLGRWLSLPRHGCSTSPYLHTGLQPAVGTLVEHCRECSKISLCLCHGVGKDTF